PHPLVSVIVGVSWILLAHNFEAATLLSALVLGIFIPRLIEPFIDRTPNIQWMPAIRLFWVVVWDIIVANITVANLVLGPTTTLRSEEHTSELQSRENLVCRLLLEKKKQESD